MSAQRDLRLIGSSFVKQYYHKLAEDRGEMQKLYASDSCFSHGDGSSEVETVKGTEAIAARLRELRYSEVDLQHGHTDVQPSGDGTVLIMVTGYLSIAGGPTRAFSQVFVLAKVNDRSYYLRNDCLRVLNAVPAPHVSAPTKTAARAANGIDDSQVVATPKPSTGSADGNDFPTSAAGGADGKSAAEVVLGPTQQTPGGGEPGATDHLAATNTPAPPTPSPVVSPSSPAEAHQHTIAAQSPESSGPKSYASIVARTNKAPVAAGTGSAVPTGSPASRSPVTGRKAPSSAAGVQQPKAGTSGFSATPDSRDAANSGVLSVFVKGLAPTTTKEDLHDVFKKFGTITSISSSHIAEGGYAHIDFSTAEECKQAIGNGKVVGKDAVWETVQGRPKPLAAARRPGREKGHGDRKGGGGVGIKGGTSVGSPAGGPSMHRRQEEDPRPAAGK